MSFMLGPIVSIFLVKVLYIVLLLQMTFSPALSREFRPCKPDPAPLLHICSTWEVRPHEVMMVGDSLKDDVSFPFATF